MATLEVGELTITDIEHARVERLADRLCGRFGAGRAVASRDLARSIRAADGFVNTKPIGMVGHPGMPLRRELLRPGL